MQVQDQLSNANSCHLSTLVLHQMAIERVILAMRERLHEPLALEDMADIAHLSPYHFSRVLHRLIGVPPGEFLGPLRLDAAKRLLLYTEKPGFEKRTDQSFGPGWRWVTIAPKGQTEVEITLMKPDPTMVGEEKAKAHTDQIGMAPTWSYTVDDCRKTYEELRAFGVKFQSPPKAEFYGVEAVCEDLYGNAISLVEPSPAMRG